MFLQASTDEIGQVFHRMQKLISCFPFKIPRLEENASHACTISLMTLHAGSQNVFPIPSLLLNGSQWPAVDLPLLQLNWVSEVIGFALQSKPDDTFFYLFCNLYKANDKAPATTLNTLHNGNFSTSWPTQRLDLVSNHMQQFCSLF